VAWGGKSEGAGRFQTAHGIFAHDGHLYVNRHLLLHQLGHFICSLYLTAKCSDQLGLKSWGLPMESENCEFCGHFMRYRRAYWGRFRPQQNFFRLSDGVMMGYSRNTTGYSQARW